MNKNDNAYKKFMAFLNSNSTRYPKDVLMYMKLHGLPLINRSDKIIPLVALQVFSELGINEDATQIYRDHIDMIRNHFSLDRNICDIGGGFLPAFANLVAEEQLKIGKGTITVYDPRLVFNEPKFDNMRLVKEEFTKDTDVSKYDLMLGIYPCEATEAIIESAIKNDKDFYVAMCGDAHSSDGSRITKVAYREKVINTANNLALTNGNYEMEVTKFDDPIYSYPIIIGKRTK